MLHFATLFDFNYLSRGLCLLDSLNKTVSGNFKLYVLALDNDTVTYFKGSDHSNVQVITLNDVESHFIDLAEAKSNRSKIEYYFTLSPILPLYILENYDCDRITSLDADIYFYADPTIIFNYYQPEAILITPHDFSANLKHLEEYGLYNVSFQSFPRTANALQVLNDWKTKCIIWCNDVLDPNTGYFADQKYLDFWKDNFDHIQNITLKTCGRAPWNIKDTRFSFKKGKVLVDGYPLIYYHFHHLRIYGNIIEHGIALYGLSEISTEIKTIYKRYLRNLIGHNKVLYSVNDKSISRYNSSKETKTWPNHLWEIELGAVAIACSAYFFNIKLIKRGYYYIKRKLNA